MVAELAAVTAAVLILIAELLHARRVRRVAGLAFGPSRRPAAWTRLVPLLRIAAVAGLAWGLTTLFLLPARIHQRGVVRESQFRDLLLVLDVSPSMRLADAGPRRNQPRRKQALALLESFFARTPLDVYRTTIVAVYTGARPVVVRTTDPEVVHNILDDLPMEYAFKSGPTDLISGVQMAAEIARPWRHGGTTLVIVSDGDTIASTGLPKLPPSIAHVVVVGVGDSKAGTFIAGHLSRQDVSSLRQLASRLNGTYHDGNAKQLSTSLVRQVTVGSTSSSSGRLTRREMSLAALTAGATILSLLPLLLHLAGTAWRPGVRPGEGR